MTKIIKLNNKETKITNSILSKIGEALYRDKGVKEVIIKVKMNDRTEIGFRRSEDEDDFKDFFLDDEE